MTNLNHKKIQDFKLKKKEMIKISGSGYYKKTDEDAKLKELVFLN
ncbi:hypothetical protein ABW636_14625 [Aquimarina sp. 2201CG1-2-11]